MPGLNPGDRVLDYGCGSGVVGAVALDRQPGIELHLLDIDAIALEAARENVPGGTTILGDGLAEVAPASFDHLLSNPPFHRGKDEDPEMLRVFVREAARVLRPGGGLTFVTQRRIPLDDALGSSFRQVSLLARDGTFVVWQALHPRGRK
jgi:16S rRNA (guanine1207-N2)-methyltransferase